MVHSHNSGATLINEGDLASRMVPAFRAFWQLERSKDLRASILTSEWLLGLACAACWGIVSQL